MEILDAAQICVRGKTKNVNVYIEALCIPLLCSSLQDQTLNDIFNENYGYLKDLALSGDYNDTSLVSYVPSASVWLTCLCALSVLAPYMPLPPCSPY